ncbi:mTERF domain-containing protein, partial [Cephalotus follicularis]
GRGGAYWTPLLYFWAKHLIQFQVGLFGPTLTINKNIESSSLFHHKIRLTSFLSIQRFLISTTKGNMELGSSQNGGAACSIMWFFKDRGFDDSSIHNMFTKCKRLQGIQSERASQNWDYLKSIGIQERKLVNLVSKCPKLLALGLDEKLVPMVQCLTTLGTKPGEVASAIVKFPHILSHSVEEKLCPLLAFFQALGVSEKQVGRIILLNPRLISYGIESKLTEMVHFLTGLGLTNDGLIGKVVVKHPFIMGYSVDKRLRPTLEFLKSVGLKDLDLQRVAVNFPHVLSRDVNKILKPNFDYLKSSGFEDAQITALVTGYPPILIKSIKNSLEPRIRFLVEVMGRQIGEAVQYPDFFRHGLKKKLESRHKLLKQRNIHCSLSEMLDCNQNKFLMKFGLLEAFA